MTSTYTTIAVLGFAGCLAGVFVFATRNKNHEACQCEDLPLPTEDMQRINPSLPEPLLTQYGAFLDVLRQVESNGDDKAIGKSGERGAYQMTNGAWQDASAWYESRGMEVTPWETGAHDPVIARSYAAIYLHGLRVRYEQGQQVDVPKPPTPQQLFALWNCGYSGCKSFGFSIFDAPTVVRKKADRFKGVKI